MSEPSLSSLIRTWLLRPVLDTLTAIQRTMLMDKTELANAIQAAADKTDKVIAEVKAGTAALEAAIVAAGNTTPDIDAALARLNASLQTADDLNPDAPAPAPAP